MSARGPSLGVIAPRIGIVRSYPRRCEIVHENAPANHIYEVISGTVCTYKVLKNGRRQITGRPLERRLMYRSIHWLARSE